MPPFTSRPSHLALTKRAAAPRARPVVTVCVLTFGDYPDLARRCLSSIQRCCDRRQYRLVVGGNALSQRTKSYLEAWRDAGHIDRLILSKRNINKCPMMRKMFSGVTTPYVCWMDDDSYFRTRGTLARYLLLAQKSPASTVMWGQAAVCNDANDFFDQGPIEPFVRAASWYRGLTPPSWVPGGKGEFNYKGGTYGDGRWIFILGGFWLMRTRALRQLDWPDRRLIKEGDDVFLGEAIRQQGWDLCNTGMMGVAVNKAKRRGEAGII